MKIVEQMLVHPDATVYDAVAAIQNGHEGIALVVDESRCLIGTVTDGDIRRAILHGIKMHDSIGLLLEHRSELYPKPTVATVGTPPDELLRIMREKVLRQIPLLDEEGRVVELALLTELIEDVQLPISAVVMAGGMGERLRPFTENMPKPMLPVNGRPLMERTIAQLREAGVERVCITTHYKSEVISEYFGDGRAFGVDIDYVNERTPLGTAGALGLMETRDHTSLVINGDILTQLDFRAMLEFHHAHRAVMTVGLRKYDFEIPYGVIETEGVNVVRLSEKPSYSFFVNAGVYLLEPLACQCIPRGERFDMTDLIDYLLKDGRQVIGFPIQEYWLDIGRPDDYEKAMKDAEKGDA